MAKPRNRYVAGIVYKNDKNPNNDEIDLESLRGVFYEQVLEHLETCKVKLQQSGLKGRATIFELIDCKRG